MYMLIVKGLVKFICNKQTNGQKPMQLFAVIAGDEAMVVSYFPTSESDKISVSPSRYRFYCMIHKWGSNTFKIVFVLFRIFCIQLVGTFKEQLIEKLEAYFTTGIRSFTDIERQDVFTTATLLDPRYKMAGFKARHKAVEAKSKLIDQAVEMAELERETISNDIQEVTTETETTGSANLDTAPGAKNCWGSLLMMMRRNVRLQCCQCR